MIYWKLGIGTFDAYKSFVKRCLHMRNMNYNFFRSVGYNQMKHISVLLIFGLAVAGQSRADSANATGDMELLNDGQRAVFQARDLIYNFSSDEERIEDLLRTGMNSFSKLADTCLRWYWSAKTEYLYGMAAMRTKDLRNAEPHFQVGRDLVNRALECNTFSDGYALLSEIYIQLMWCKGTTYQLRYVNRLRDLPVKALDLDPMNVHATQSLAVFCIKAPEAFGGGIDKGIKLLTGAHSNDRGVLFTKYYLLGTAYSKKKDRDKAIECYQMALNVYPRNRWAHEDMAKVMEN
jgi:tetratricopeptide (TPR) repeat protein